MSKDCIVGIDAGFTNIGVVIAGLPSRPDELPELWEAYVLSVKRTPVKILKRDEIPVTLEHTRRIEGQLKNLRCTLVRDDIYIRGLFAELPVGGGQSAASVRGMAFGTSILVSFVHAYLPEVPYRYFSPYDLKEALTGHTKAAKGAVTERVHALFPDMTWPVKSSVGLKVTTFDAEDAAAALVTGQQTQLYKSLCR